MLEIARTEDRATQGCDLSADPGADTRGAMQLSPPVPLMRSGSHGNGYAVHKIQSPVCPKALNPRGLGTESPSEKMPGLLFEKLLTNGGESNPHP